VILNFYLFLRAFHQITPIQRVVYTACHYRLQSSCEKESLANTRAAIKGVKAFYRIARHARMLITLMNIYSIAACNLSQAASQRAAVA